MLDPATALRDLEALTSLPCEGWSEDLAGRGIELDCGGVAAGQEALRHALAGGGTHHDVLGRMRRAVESAKLSARRRLVALTVAEVATAAARRRVALALAQLGSPSPNTASPA
ncbi:MAG: hypothetical protein ACYC2H_02615 [Thermoplasmatota archaeon]